MTAVTIEITSPPITEDEPAGVVIVEDIEDLTEGATPGCNDDNPYR